ncbi:hypothetical protein V6N13_026637 [Hibiscus sabdariffa]
MASSSSSSANDMPPIYQKVAAQSRWDEQGFFFDDAQPNYGLEPIIYKRLNDLGWFRFARQPARTYLNWVLEFYTSNAAGEDTITVRGSRPHLQPEAKLWNTFVKRNLMPTSHNQTVDRTRLVLINAIITVYKFNVGEVIARELSAACQNDKGILAFPYLISALCRRTAVPAQPADKYTPDEAGWTRKEYMRKMEIADAIPIQMAMPTPPASEQPKPIAPAGRAPSPAATPPADHATSPAPTPAATPATQDSRQSTPASPMGSTPTPPPSPPPA